MSRGSASENQHKSIRVAGGIKLNNHFLFVHKLDSY